MTEHFAMKLKLGAPASTVYRAIASAGGPRNWWTKFAECNDRVGGVSRFSFPKAGFYAAMRIRTLEFQRLIEWECIEQVHSGDTGWSDLHDWEGTLVRFEIVDKGEGGCDLHFEHVGLSPVLECYETCNSAWHHYLSESLRAYVERGEGMPFADDSEDNIMRGERANHP